MKDGSPWVVGRLAFWALLVAAMLWPNLAWANAGTPLMWISALHMLFGNFAIGVVEGAILALLFKRRFVWCILAMIAANYFSAWVGGVVLVGQVLGQLDLDLYNAWRWMWILVGAAYLATLVLEWPFVALCLRKTDGWFWKSLVGSLFVQTISYLALFGGYWMVSGKALFTELDAVQPSEIHMPANAVVYYISQSDGDVYRLDLGRLETKKVVELGSTDMNDRLYFQGSLVDAGRWDLKDAASKRTVLPVIACQTASSSTQRDPAEATWHNVGAVARFDTKEESGWEFACGFWAMEGLRGTHRDGRHLRLAAETPFVEWMVRNATQLPDDKVVFQLHTDQICVVAPETRRVALLARGRGPAVALIPTQRGEE